MRRAAQAFSRCLAAGATFAPAAAALVAILCIGYFAERLTGALAMADLRERVRLDAEDVRLRLDQSLAASLGGLSALEATLSASPEPDRAALARAAADLIARDPLVRAIAVLPAAGPALARPEPDAASAELAAGLANGPATAGSARFAGAGPPAMLVWSGRRAAMALDLGALDALAAMPGAGPAVDIALTRGPAGAREAPFASGEARAAPVTLNLALPDATWRLEAAPRGGWDAPGDGLWIIRAATFLIAALIVGPMLRTGALVEERQRHIADLEDREIQLARLSRRHGLALDASRVGVWDYGIDASTLVWDDRMDELYGLPRDGRARGYADWRDRLHPEDLARAEEEFRAAIDESRRYVSDYRLILPDGSVRHIRAIGAVYRDPDGAARIVGVNWDVTPDVRRSAELVEKQREAEAASVAKSQFLATMSHEIRTPMNGVLGMLDLLLRTRLTAEQRSRAEIARDSAANLLTILNDILDFSRLEANGIALDLAPARPAALIHEIVALLSAAAAERGLTIETAVDPATPEWLICDAARLRQVVLNLLGNALKFTDAGRIDVLIGYEPAPGGPCGVLEVAVRDTGLGIPEADRGRLFERFVQVDSSITRQRGGAGLGLAISRQLVELMGGEISVQSTPGAGSTFRFRIPAESCASATVAAPESLPARAPGRAAAQRILLVEDNATNQHILAAFLRLEGHDLRIVDNGAVALAAIAAEPFDLVLMDIQMPEMDGMTATRRIRAMSGPASSVPIIALTANAMKGDREQYIAAGMNDYVSKPVSAAELHAAVARVSRQPAARRA